MSRAAFALAEKFKLAIERKAVERKRRYEEAGMEVVWVQRGGMGCVVRDGDGEGADVGADEGGVDVDVDAMDVEEPNNKGQSQGQSQGQGQGRKPRVYLVSYNVYVLTDPMPVLARETPWLLTRLPGVNEHGHGSGSGSGCGWEGYPSYSGPIAPTNPDGSVNEMGVAAAAIASTNAGKELIRSSHSHSNSHSHSHSHSTSQTQTQTQTQMILKTILPAVDFAERERAALMKTLEADQGNVARRLNRRATIGPRGGRRPRRKRRRENDTPHDG